MGMFTRAPRKEEQPPRVEEIQQKKEIVVEESKTEKLFNAGVQKGRELNNGYQTLREIWATVADKFATGFTVTTPQADTLLIEAPQQSNGDLDFSKPSIRIKELDNSTFSISSRTLGTSVQGYPDTVIEYLGRFYGKHTPAKNAAPKISI